jgi:hypothetical protein
VPAILSNYHIKEKSWMKKQKTEPSPAGSEVKPQPDQSVEATGSSPKPIPGDHGSRGESITSLRDGDEDLMRDYKAEEGDRFAEFKSADLRPLLERVQNTLVVEFAFHEHEPASDEAEHNRFCAPFVNHPGIKRFHGFAGDTIWCLHLLMIPFPGAERPLRARDEFALSSLLLLLAQEYGGQFAMPTVVSHLHLAPQCNPPSGTHPDKAGEDGGCFSLLRTGLAETGCTGKSIEFLGQEFTFFRCFHRSSRPVSPEGERVVRLLRRFIDRLRDPSFQGFKQEILDRGAGSVWSIAHLPHAAGFRCRDGNHDEQCEEDLGLGLDELGCEGENKCFHINP